MIFKMRWMAALAAIVILSAATIGCVDQQISSRLLIDQVRLADENLKTYEMEMDVSQGVSGTDAGEAFASNVSYHMTVTADKKNQRMNIIANGTSSGQGEIQSEITVIGNTWYIKGGDPSNPDMWVKTEMSQAALEQQDTVSQHLGLLEGSDFEIIDSEQVDGVDSHRIALHPNTETLLNIIAQQGINPQVLMYSENIEDVIPHMSFIQWYDSQTFLPVKSTIEMSVVLNPETMGIDAGIDAAIDIAQETNIAYNHMDDPVSIILSPEAKNATEVN